MLQISQTCWAASAGSFSRNMSKNENFLWTRSGWSVWSFQAVDGENADSLDSQHKEWNMLKKFSMFKKLVSMLALKLAPLMVSVMKPDTRNRLDYYSSDSKASRCRRIWTDGGKHDCLISWAWAGEPFPTSSFCRSHEARVFPETFPNVSSSDGVGAFYKIFIFFSFSVTLITVVM